MVFTSNEAYKRKLESLFCENGINLTLAFVSKVFTMDLVVASTFALLVKISLTDSSNNRALGAYPVSSDV